MQLNESFCTTSRYRPVPFHVSACNFGPMPRGVPISCASPAVKTPTVDSFSARTSYALKGLAGLRHGEAAGLRWSHYDEQAEPLGALNLAKTKTQVPRRVPVHPTLARVLAEWKLAGWERTYGRMPTPDDLIVPTRNMTERTAQETPKQLHEELDMLGLRRRRGKLKIGLREGRLVDGSFGGLATEFATSQQRARNRWRKVVTPSGLEPEITP